MARLPQLVPGTLNALVSVICPRFDLELDNSDSTVSIFKKRLAGHKSIGGYFPYPTAGASVAVALLARRWSAAALESRLPVVADSAGANVALADRHCAPALFTSVRSHLNISFIARNLSALLCALDLAGRAFALVRVSYGQEIAAASAALSALRAAFAAAQSFILLLSFHTLASLAHLPCQQVPRVPAIMMRNAALARQSSAVPAP